MNWVCLQRENPVLKSALANKNLKIIMGIPISEKIVFIVKQNPCIWIDYSITTSLSEIVLENPRKLKWI